MSLFDLAYPRLPENIRKPLWSLYLGLTPHLGVGIPFTCLQGPLRSTDRRATILVAGRSPRLCPYLSELLFSSAPAIEELGSSTIWTLSQRLAELRGRCDLAIAWLDCENARRILGNDHLLLPSWVGLRRTIPEQPMNFGKLSDSIRSSLRILRRENLRAVISRDPDDVPHFRERYHLPTMQRRHGDAAVVHSLARLRATHREGFLLWIERAGERIGGCLVHHRDGVLRLSALGVRDGDPRWTALGGQFAIYYFTCTQARELGASVVDFGGSWPFLRDGVFRFKRNWRSELTGPLDLSFFDFALSWRRWSPALADILADLGPVFRQGTRLSAISCLDVDHPAGAGDAERAHSLLWTPGLSRLYLVSRTGWQSGISAPENCALLDPSSVRPELLARME
jgi:hypothetical protein